jgi:hypothetical protein
MSHTRALGIVMMLGITAVGGIMALGSMSSAVFNFPAKSSRELPLESLRITARYVYKGEPVTLDFLHVCGGTVTVMRDRDATVRILGGPRLYGHRMPDGKALVVYANLCSFADRPVGVVQGVYLSPRGLVDTMPFTILYDDANLLTQGYGYASEAAYERPGSPLKFIDMRIERITSEAAREFAKTMVPNVVRVLGNGGEVPKNKPPLKEAPLAYQCIGFIRVKVSEEARARMREEWPDHKPQYWVVTDSSRAWNLSQDVRYSFDKKKNPHWPVERLEYLLIPHQGFPIRHIPRPSKPEEWMNTSGYMSPPIYPRVMTYLEPAQREAFGTTRVFNERVVISPETNGLLRCGYNAFATVAELKATLPGIDWDAPPDQSGLGVRSKDGNHNYRELSALVTVNNQKIFGKEHKNELVHHDFYFYERDEYFFHHIYVGLVNSDVRDQGSER